VHKGARWGSPGQEVHAGQTGNVHEGHAGQAVHELHAGQEGQAGQQVHVGHQVHEARRPSQKLILVPAAASPSST